MFLLWNDYKLKKIIANYTTSSYFYINLFKQFVTIKIIYCKLFNYWVYLIIRFLKSEYKCEINYYNFIKCSGMERLRFLVGHLRFFHMTLALLYRYLYLNNMCFWWLQSSSIWLHELSVFTWHNFLNGYKFNRHCDVHSCSKDVAWYISKVIFITKSKDIQDTFSLNK